MSQIKNHDEIIADPIERPTPNRMFSYLLSISAMLFLAAPQGQCQDRPPTAPIAKNSTPVQAKDQLDSLERQLQSMKERGVTEDAPEAREVEGNLMRAIVDEDDANQQNSESVKGSAPHFIVPVLYAFGQISRDAATTHDARNPVGIQYGKSRVTIQTELGVKTQLIKGIKPVSSLDARMSSSSRIPLNEYDFEANIRRNLLYKPKQERTIVLFVHGFYTSFDEAVERTALVALQLGIPAVPVAYVWPSANQLTGYLHDEDVAHASEIPFSKFLQSLLDHNPDANVVIVCHSMGSRVVAGALTELIREHNDLGGLSHVIFAAADIPISTFQVLWPFLSAVTKVGYGFYASDHDLALRLSSCIHWQTRLGEGGLRLWPPPGAMSVDVSTAGGPLSHLGHSYIVDSAQVGADIGEWVEGTSPSARGLIQSYIHNQPFYLFH